ncbi:MAG: hypothetical protein QOC81_13 [Thermoanaerobaculia bacterium]|jgi:hypothetical protein|nr:hypothetical protein [Thermoanaerobaculia bacterium]
MVPDPLNVQASKTPKSSDDKDFDVRQHDSLREEIQAAEAAARANERYAIIALAALWAWTAKEAPSIGFVSAVISMLIGVLGGLRMWALWINMHTKAGYIAQIERLLSREELGGWEHYFRDATAGAETIPSRTASRRKADLSGEVERELERKWHQRPGAIGYTSAAFWLLVIIGSPFLGWYVANLPKTASVSTVVVRCTNSR